MPFVKRVNTRETEELLGRLAAAGRECGELEAAVELARRRRDELVVQASSAGATRRDVAAAAQISAGRVQQMLDAP